MWNTRWEENHNFEVSKVTLFCHCCFFNVWHFLTAPIMAGQALHPPPSTQFPSAFLGPLSQTFNKVLLVKKPPMNWSTFYMQFLSKSWVKTLDERNKPIFRKVLMTVSHPDMPLFCCRVLCIMSSFKTVFHSFIFHFLLLVRVKAFVFPGSLRGELGDFSRITIFKASLDLIKINFSKI